MFLIALLTPQSGVSILIYDLTLLIQLKLPSSALWCPSLCLSQSSLVLPLPVNAADDARAGEDAADGDLLGLAPGLQQDPSSKKRGNDGVIRQIQCFLSGAIRQWIADGLKLSPFRNTLRMKIFFS